MDCKFTGSADAREDRIPLSAVASATKMVLAGTTFGDAIAAITPVAGGVKTVTAAAEAEREALAVPGRGATRGGRDAPKQEHTRPQHRGAISYFVFVDVRGCARRHSFPLPRRREGTARGGASVCRVRSPYDYDVAPCRSYGAVRCRTVSYDAAYDVGSYAACFR